MVEMIVLKDREEWLQHRNRIGGSDAAAIVGMNPYRSNVELWQIKTGQLEQEDISEKSYVKYGTEAEQYLRELFRLDFPEYTVCYEENNMFLNDKYPFGHASLDGWLIDEDGRKGMYMKEQPCDEWAKEHNSKPFLGLMASEGGQREESLVEHGCNYFGKNTIRSAPFAPFLRQDLLRLALDLKVPVPEIYGTIERKADGTLYTTGAQRTGCSMCGFGVHLEKRPHRFDQLRKRNPKEWEYWMYRCCTDPATGEKYGWGRVLDYIGVAWKDEYQEVEQLELKW